MLKHIDHINIVCRDLANMLEFYCDVLGFKVTKDVVISGDWIEHVVGLKNVEARVVYIALEDGPRVELIDYRSPPGKIAQGQGDPNTCGLRHMAFKVDDIDAAYEKLQNAGVSFAAEPMQVPDSQVTYARGVRKRLVYFHDPEGNLLELCEYRAS